MPGPIKSDREIFDGALEIEDAGERATYLKQECVGNSAQMGRVQALLDAHESAGAFLQTAAIRGSPDGTERPRMLVRSSEGPGSVIGHYKLLQEIGEGGFGMVYMAEQLQPVKRKVALKIIKPGMDSREVVARFEAERQALALMVHPNIAQVFDAGTTEAGRPYFVMELVKGIPITEFCDKNKFSTLKRLELFLDVCSAVQHAHQKGVIHRDIKPSNILITLHDGRPVPKVIDFGIAKAINQELTGRTLFTVYGSMIGTPAYMSPEQAEMSGLDIDTRSDIYSLGVLLYELLTGETPISGNELKEAGYAEMQRLIREKEPTKPSMAVSISCRQSTTLSDFHQEGPDQLISAMKGDLDWIVLKALEKDRNRRYETASDFAQDIKRHLSDEAVVARPPSPGYLFLKWVRRNRLAFGASAAVMLSTFAGLGVSTHLYIREKAARERATQSELEQSRLRKDAELQERMARKAAARAEEAGAKTASALKQVEMALIDELIEKGQPDLALARLARQLRADAANHVTAERTLFLLQEHGVRAVLQPAIAANGTASIWRLSPDGLKLAAALRDSVQVWDSTTGKMVGKPLLEGHRATDLDFNADSSLLAVTTRFPEPEVTVWDVLTGLAEGKPMRHGNIIHSARFSPDGQFVATSSWDYRALMWDTHAGSRTGLAMQHGHDVSFAEFSPDGKLLAT